MTPSHAPPSADGALGPGTLSYREFWLTHREAHAYRIARSEFCFFRYASPEGLLRLPLP